MHQPQSRAWSSTDLGGRIATGLKDEISRRDFLSAAALVAVCPGALAQTAEPPVIGWLRTNAAERPPGEPLRLALARHGLREGRDYRLSLKNTGGDNARFPALAREFVYERPALVIAFGSVAVRAMQAETKDIPIIGTGDLVGLGFAQSTARPAGNVTGVDISAPELDLKKLEILRELIPSADSAAFIYDASVTPDVSRTHATASRVGFTLYSHPVSNTAGLEAAFERVAGRVIAVNVGNAPLLAQNRQLIIDLLRRHRLAGICEWREMAEAGCLASYGFALDDLVGLVADYAARILRGARPGQLPIIAPARMKLVINTKVARELGLTIPKAMLARADEVID